MIRFKIDGFWIDSPNDLKLSLQYLNQLFAFDKIELSRSLEFEIPETPTNNEIFQFSNRIDQDGGFVRIKHNAEVHYSGGITTGIFVVSRYVNNKYKCIFVYGNLLKLKEIKDAGNIGSYTEFTDWLTPSPVNVLPVGNMTQNFAFYDYNNGNTSLLHSYLNMFPTVRLNYLLNSASLALGININTPFPDLTNRLGIKLNKERASGAIEDITIQGLHSINNYFYIDNCVFPVIYNAPGGYTNAILNIQSYRAKRDINITIPDSYTDRICLITDEGGNWHAPGNPTYYVSPPYNPPAGTPPPQIYANTNFLLKKDHFLYFAPVSTWGLWGWCEWYYGSTENIPTTHILCKSVGSYVFPENYYLQTNLPELNYLDLCKILTNLTDTGLIWNNEENKIEFFDYNFDLTKAIDLTDKLIEITEINRTFCDFAQKNNVVFENNESVVEQFIKYYNVLNYNLEEEKEIAKLPISSSDRDTANGAIIVDFVKQENNSYKNEAKKEIIVYANTPPNDQNILGAVLDLGAEMGENTSSPNYLRKIIGNSTMIKVKAFMYMFEFQAIEPKTVLKIQGKYFVFYSAKWTNNIIEADLININ